MEDAKIVALFFERSEQALKEARHKYGRYCRNIAFRILKSREDAEECENDTLIHAWEAIPPKRPHKLGVFLGKIARNLALDRYDYAHAKKRGGDFVTTALDELTKYIPDPKSLDKLNDSELLEIINHFLKELPDESRIFFVQRYWYGFSISEIAKNQRATQGKVKMSLMRSRKQLAEDLTQEGVTLYG